jgi:predicted dienelactone hydrolase
VNFGYRIVNRSGSAKPVTLTNTGTTAMNITGITFSGTDPNDFSQTNTCGSSVGSGAFCTIDITFVPAQRGVRSATALIADSSTDSPQQIDVSGTGFTLNASEESAVRSTVAGSMIAAAPLPTGPEPVGTRTFDWIDNSRPDPFLAHSVSRELLVRLWYPASLTKTCEAADYTAPGVWTFFSHLLGVPLPRVTTNSCLNAPVAGGVHPIVVFSHGYTGTFTDYTFLFEDLASHGYIVASVNHTFEATATEFPDGRFITSVVGSYIDNTWRADEKTLALASSVRLQDLKFALNQLDGLNRHAGNPFAHRLDLSRVAVAGHSAGGTIAFRALGQDPRFKAAVILDGYLSPTDIHQTLAAVLILRAGSETDTADRCLLASSLRDPHLLVNLSGAEHLTPTDALWVARGAIASGPMGPDRTIAAIRDYVSSFLDTNLRETAGVPLMSSPSAKYPDSGLSQEGQSCTKP